MTLRVAPIQPGDLPAVCELHIRSWRHAYRGMVEDAFLEDEVEPLLAARWSEMPGQGWLVLGAWRDGTLAGFVAADLDRGGGAYVDNLHVDPDAKRRGIGRRLMAAAAAQVAAAGIAMIWLTVMRENRAARAFYAGIGGVEGPERVERMYSQKVAAFPVVWRDLAALSALAEKPGGGAV